MAEIGRGYGSEFHLLRYLGHHRARLNRAVVAATGAGRVEWLDVPFDATRVSKDGEWRGVDFLPDDSPGRAAWQAAWPRRGNTPNWDAIGRLDFGGRADWLLVEAKAHVAELRSDCGASANGGRPQIAALLDRTKAAIGVPPGHDWLSGYYQYANRLAVLSLLNGAGVPARLLMVYFTGDRNGSFECPADASGWRPGLDAADRHLGIAGGHSLAARVHKVFLEVVPATTGTEMSFS